jgi:hypothetical protein
VLNVCLPCLKQRLLQHLPSEAVTAEVFLQQLSSSGLYVAAMLLLPAAVHARMPSLLLAVLLHSPQCPAAAAAAVPAALQMWWRRRAC